MLGIVEHGRSGEEEPGLAYYALPQAIHYGRGVFKYFPKIMRHTYKFENNIKIKCLILLTHILLKMNKPNINCNTLFLMPCDNFFYQTF